MKDDNKKENNEEYSKDQLDVQKRLDEQRKKTVQIIEEYRKRWQKKKK